MTGGPPTKSFYVSAAFFALIVVGFPSLLIASTVWMDPYPQDLASRLSEARTLFFQAIGGTLFGLVVICPLALLFGGSQVLLDSPLVGSTTNDRDMQEDGPNKEKPFQETIEENI